MSKSILYKQNQSELVTKSNKKLNYLRYKEMILQDFEKNLKTKKTISTINNLSNINVRVKEPNILQEYLHLLECAVSESIITTNDNNTENEKAFNDFIKNNLNNPQFKDKYVAFVHGKFQDAGYKENALMRKMCAKFGNVHMYIEQITDSPRIVRLNTPEFI